MSFEKHFVNFYLKKNKKLLNQRVNFYFVLVGDSKRFSYAKDAIKNQFKVE